MLETLHVKNLAIISEAEVEFGPGLNILTGETGAGKSVILGGVNLALGQKASKDQIRSGAKEALAELVFSVSDQNLKKELAELGYETEENCLIFSRKISDSRSVCKLNGEQLPASKLKEAGSYLIDIHGQQDSRFLLNKKNHLHLLDGFAGKEIEDLLHSYQEQYATFRSLQKELKENQLNEEERRRELSFLEFEINEIESAGLKEGEDEEIEESFRVMSAGRQILEALSSVLALTGSEGAGAMTGDAIRQLAGVIRYDESLEELGKQLEEIDSLLDDFQRDLGRAIEEHTFSDEAFAEVEQRYDLINQLKRKYGKSIAEIQKALAEKKETFEKLEYLQDWTWQKNAECEKVKKKALALAEELHALREKSAVSLSKEIEKTLTELNFLQAKFEVRIEKREELTEKGLDQVGFYLSTNPGEDLRPLEKIASGGELSRIMLALKSVSADRDDTESLIFDEIDSGISGRTAQAVAEKLKKLSEDHQIICITHLPQIAAMADRHFLIEKNVEDGKTASCIRFLEEEESVMELARMMGGAELTGAAIENAREMKKMARF
jgi:DNA repair protein RecN (Recombination protein N)